MNSQTLIVIKLVNKPSQNLFKYIIIHIVVLKTQTYELRKLRSPVAKALKLDKSVKEVKMLQFSLHDATN